MKTNIKRLINFVNRISMKLFKQNILIIKREKNKVSLYLWKICLIERKTICL